MWLLIQVTSEATVVVTLADPFFFFLARSIFLLLSASHLNQDCEGLEHGCVTIIWVVEDKSVNKHACICHQKYTIANLAQAKFRWF
jgi:hypothetical protein